MRKDLINKSKKYLDEGISVIPVNATSKAPLLPWAKYQKEYISIDLIDETISKATSTESGIALICGKISNNLMVLDFDNKLDNAESILYDFIGLPDIYDTIEKHQIPIVKTQNKGFHIMFKVEDPVDGNQKLAQAKDKNGKIQTLIETRGEGGYFITYPTKGYTECINKTTDPIPTIAREELELLINAAKSFNEQFRIHEEPIKSNPPTHSYGSRPGDEFNNSSFAMDNVRSALQQNGWKNKGGVYWCRPNKGKGVSATLNYKDSGLFYVFTSSTEFEPSKAYKPFSVLSILNHNGDFSKCASELYNKGFGNKENEEIIEEQNDVSGIKKENNVPDLPDNVFNDLPPILKEIVESFDTPIERTLLLLSSLTVLSHCFSEVQGTYDYKVVYPNLYLFIAMPASSGKGIMNFSYKIGQEFDKLYKKEYDEAKLAYDIDKENRESEKGKKTTHAPLIKPRRVFFSIPANVSTAAFGATLENNSGKGLIFETEADVLSRNKSQKWGDISSELRQAFHHEKISFARKKEDERVEIICPRLSLLLSGTIKQISRFIPDEEDGLFSRFLFFYRNGYSEYRSPFRPSKKGNLEEFFQLKSKEVFTLSNKLTKSVKFELTKEQVKLFNNTFHNVETEIIENKQHSLFSSARRTGIITYKIAMIFATLRIPSDFNGSGIINCTNSDFESAISITQTLLEHASTILHKLYGSKDAQQPWFKFLVLLPNKFTRKDAERIGKDNKIGMKSVDAHLTKLVKLNHIKRVERGLYEKYNAK